MERCCFGLPKNAKCLMSLSDKACYVGDIVPNLIIFKKEDVKQFIKELKEGRIEHINDLGGSGDEMMILISVKDFDELAGKELI